MVMFIAGNNIPRILFAYIVCSSYRQLIILKKLNDNMKRILFDRPLTSLPVFYILRKRRRDLMVVLNLPLTSFGNKLRTAILMSLMLSV